MKKENLDDYELPYVDFYLEIPKHTTDDYLEQIKAVTSDQHNQPRESGGLSNEQVDELRRDSLDAAAQDAQSSGTDDDHGLFSPDNLV